MSRSGSWLLAAALLGAGLAYAADTKTDETKLSKDEAAHPRTDQRGAGQGETAAVEGQRHAPQGGPAHAANMAKQHKMEHVLDDKNPAQRIEKAGYDYRSVGENIATGEKGATVDDVFKGWMESKVHRDNILSPKYDEIGLGLATDDKGETYYTQDFGKQQPKD